MTQEVIRIEARADLRRRQILDAADICFCAKGFHAATMAEIAAEAGLSVGQIYRFFENKEALIEAITNQEMDELIDTVADIEGRQGAEHAMRALMRKGFEMLRRPGRAALLLEITAEASRNPRVALVVRDHDRQIREALTGLMAKSNAPGDQKDLECRAEFMCLVFEGAAARMIRNSTLDDEALQDLQDWVLAILLKGLSTACQAG